MSQRHDYLVKIVLIGDSGVGKSSFVLKYCDNSFKTNVMSTIGVDFKIKRLTIDGKVVKLQIVSFIFYFLIKCINFIFYYIII